MTVGAVVPAAGLGLRLGPGGPKALRLLAGEPVLVHVVRGLRACEDVGPIVVAAPAEDLDLVRTCLAALDVTVVAGGPQRHDSVVAALAALPEDVQLVLVHDAARCLTPAAVVGAVVEALLAGAACVVPVLPVTDTVKRVDGDRVLQTVPRADLRAVQTPQGFRREVLARAHQQAPTQAHAQGMDLHTDDAGRVEALGEDVRTVPGSPLAFKITGPLDLLLAEAVLAAR